MLPRFCLFGAGVLLLSGCSADIKRDIKILQRDIGQIRSIQADHHAQLTQLQEEQAGLMGRLEEIEHSQTNKFDSSLDSLKNQVDTLSRRVPPPTGISEKFLDADASLAASLSPDVGGRFQKGLDLIRVGKFNEAISVLQTALDASVGMSHSGNIYYWLGVSYQQLRDFKNALRAYNEVVTGYTKSDRVPASLLRQGLVFKELGDLTTYEVTLRKLIKDFPNSEEAKRAQTLLGSAAKAD